MEKISATELNKHPGQILMMAAKTTVLIEKNGTSAAVMVPYDYFCELEDYYYGRQAEDIEKTGNFISIEDSEKFLNDL